MSKSTHPLANDMLPPGDHPFAARKTVETVVSQHGKIISIDGVNMGIQTKNEKVLMPVNLPHAFARNGLNVVFSGTVKESGLNELTAGQPFVLTQIKEQ